MLLDQRGQRGLRAILVRHDAEPAVRCAVDAAEQLVVGEAAAPVILRLFLERGFVDLHDVTLAPNLHRDGERFLRADVSAISVPLHRCLLVHPHHVRGGGDGRTRTPVEEQADELTQRELVLRKEGARADAPFRAARRARAAPTLVRDVQPHRVCALGAQE